MPERGCQAIYATVRRLGREGVDGFPAPVYCASMAKKISYAKDMQRYAERRALWRMMLREGHSMAAIGRMHNISRQAVRTALVNSK